MTSFLDAIERRCDTEKRTTRSWQKEHRWKLEERDRAKVRRDRRQTRRQAKNSAPPWSSNTTSATTARAQSLSDRSQLRLSLSDSESSTSKSRNPPARLQFSDDESVIATNSESSDDLDLGDRVAPRLQEDSEAEDEEEIDNDDDDDNDDDGGAEQEDNYSDNEEKVSSQQSNSSLVTADYPELVEAAKRFGIDIRISRLLKGGDRRYADADGVPTFHMTTRYFYQYANVELKPRTKFCQYPCEIRLVLGPKTQLHFVRDTEHRLIFAVVEPQHTFHAPSMKEWASNQGLSLGSWTWPGTGAVHYVLSYSNGQSPTKSQNRELRQRGSRSHKHTQKAKQPNLHQPGLRLVPVLLPEASTELGHFEQQLSRFQVHLHPELHSNWSSTFTRIRYAVATAEEIAAIEMHRCFSGIDSYYARPGGVVEAHRFLSGRIYVKGELNAPGCQQDVWYQAFKEIVPALLIGQQDCVRHWHRLENPVLWKLEPLSLFLPLK